MVISSFIGLTAVFCASFKLSSLSLFSSSILASTSILGNITSPFWTFTPLLVPSKENKLSQVVSCTFNCEFIFSLVSGKNADNNTDAKIEELNKLKEASLEEAQKASVKPIKEEITIEDFEKIDLRVVKVLECEPVKKANKLYKLKVDLAGETRQVISGIAKYYKPEELVGKYVVLVANLKPVKLRGELSEGMILAAATDDDSKLFTVTIPGELPTGSEVR